MVRIGYSGMWGSWVSLEASADAVKAASASLDIDIADLRRELVVRAGIVVGIDYRVTFGNARSVGYKTSSAPVAFGVLKPLDVEITSPSEGLAATVTVLSAGFAMHDTLEVSVYGVTSLASDIGQPEVVMATIAIYVAPSTDPPVIYAEVQNIVFSPLFFFFF